MAKQHLIKHYGKYINRYEDYQSICDDDDCSGQILSLFEFWTICRMEDIKRVRSYNEQSKKSRGHQMVEPDLWLYETISDINKGLINGYSDKQIRTSLKKLENKGFISARPTANKFDKTKEFLFCTEIIQKALDEWWISKNAETLTESDAVKLPLDTVELPQETVELPFDVEKLPLDAVKIPSDLYINSLNKQSSLTFISTATEEAAAALKKINSDLVQEDCLEPKTLEEREQVLKQDEDLDQPNRTSKPTIDNSSNVANSQEVISPNDKTTHEDKSCGGGREVVMTSTCNKLLSVVLKNAGIKENSKLLRFCSTYKLEQVCGAIAYLQYTEDEKCDRGEFVENREGYFRDALKDDYTADYFERMGYDLEMQQTWITGHTARLLGLCDGFSIMNNCMTIKTANGDRNIDLIKLADFVATEGWGAFIEKVELSRRGVA
jgi:hypothetical protein